VVDEHKYDAAMFIDNIIDEAPIQTPTYKTESLEQHFPLTPTGQAYTSDEDPSEHIYLDDFESEDDET